MVLDRFSDNPPNTKSGQTERIEKATLSMAKNALEYRIGEKWPDKLSTSMHVPVIYEEKENDVVKTDQQSLVFNLKGGEKIELGRAEMEGLVLGKDNLMVVKITGGTSKGELIEHPFVTVKKSGFDMEVKPLEGSLQENEEKEILRWMAVFNPKDIILDNIEFEDFSKLVVLNAFGVSLADKEIISPISIDDFKKELKGNNPEIDRLREQAFIQLEDFEQIPELFSREELEEVFGPEPEEWLYGLYFSIQPFGSAPLTFDQRAFSAVMVDPNTNQEMPLKKLRKVMEFALKHRLIQKIESEGNVGDRFRYAGNPIVNRKMNELVKDIE